MQLDCSGGFFFPKNSVICAIQFYIPDSLEHLIKEKGSEIAAIICNLSVPDVFRRKTSGSQSPFIQ